MGSAEVSREREREWEEEDVEELKPDQELRRRKKNSEQYLRLWE